MYHFYNGQTISDLKKSFIFDTAEEIGQAQFPIRVCEHVLAHTLYIFRGVRSRKVSTAEYVTFLRRLLVLQIQIQIQIFIDSLRLRSRIA